MIFIDGDFDGGKGNCEYHCSPTCHPAQVGPDWKYGCKHEAWPQNKCGDFVPIVECEGNKNKCELIKKKWLCRYIGGLTRRKLNLERKLKEIKSKIDDIEKLKKSSIG